MKKGKSKKTGKKQRKKQQEKKKKRKKESGLNQSNADERTHRATQLTGQPIVILP